MMLYWSSCVIKIFIAIKMSNIIYIENKGKLNQRSGLTNKKFVKPKKCFNKWKIISIKSLLLKNHVNILQSIQNDVI